MDADSFRGIVLESLRPNYGTVAPAPSGDSPIGRVWSFQPAANGNPEYFKLEQPRITFGVSALDNTSGPITLIGGQWNLLASAPGPDGFRAGLVSYIPQGRWGIDGQVQISSVYPNTRFDLVVIQGVNPDPVYQHIMSQPFAGQPGLEVGGCSWHSPNVANGMFTMPIYAPDIQCNAPWLEFQDATEVLVYVFPHIAAGLAAGGAMNVIGPSALGGGVGMAQSSKLTAKRWNEAF